MDQTIIEDIDLKIEGKDDLDRMDFVGALKRLEDAAERIGAKGYKATLHVDKYTWNAQNLKKQPSWTLKLKVEEPAVIMVGKGEDTKATIAESFQICIYEHENRKKPALHVKALTKGSDEKTTVRYAVKLDADLDTLQLSHLG